MATVQNNFITELSSINHVKAAKPKAKHKSVSHVKITKIIPKPKLVNRVEIKN